MKYMDETKITNNNYLKKDLRSQFDEKIQEKSHSFNVLMKERQINQRRKINEQIKNNLNNNKESKWQ